MSPLRIGEDEKVVLSQKSLLIILGAVLTCGAAWADLKYTLKDHQRAIDALTAASNAAATTTAADHEIILHMADQLRWAVKDQASHEHNPDKDMPKN